MRDELRKKRESRGWSVRDTAEKTELTKSKYHQIELGQADPTPEEALRICQLFGCTFKQMFPELVPVFLKEAALRSYLVAGLQIQTA